MAAWLRRRMRRIAEARPVTDDVVERDIMVVLFVCFLARRHRVMGDRLRGRGSRSGRHISCLERRLCGVCARGRERGLGARPGSSRRTGYPASMRSNAVQRQAPWSGRASSQDADCALDQGRRPADRLRVVITDHAWLHAAPTESARSCDCPRCARRHDRLRRSYQVVDGAPRSRATSHRIGTLDDRGSATPRGSSTRSVLTDAAWSARPVAHAAGDRHAHDAVSGDRGRAGLKRELRPRRSTTDNPGRVDLAGRAASRPAGPPSCAAAGSPSTASSTDGNDGDQGHARRRPSRPTRPPATQRIDVSATTRRLDDACRSTSGSTPNAAGAGHPDDRLPRSSRAPRPRASRSA